MSVNGQSCNFIEAGLTTNTDPVPALTDRAEIVEVLEGQYEGEEIEVVFQGGLADDLTNEIRAYGNMEPNVQMFVDSSSIFWVSKDGRFVWMADHTGINEYTNDEHQIVEEKTPEGVGNEGVYWMNGDFESPFHISDFLARIETVNV